MESNFLVPFFRSRFIEEYKCLFARNIKRASKVAIPDALFPKDFSSARRDGTSDEKGNNFPVATGIAEMGLIIPKLPDGFAYTPRKTMRATFDNQEDAKSCRGGQEAHTGVAQ